MVKRNLYSVKIGSYNIVMTEKIRARRAAPELRKVQKKVQKKVARKAGRGAAARTTTARCMTPCFRPPSGCSNATGSQA